MGLDEEKGSMFLQVDAIGDKRASFSIWPSTCCGCLMKGNAYVRAVANVLLCSKTGIRPGRAW